jgi:ribosomal protein S18 acetylase RimI-like enzyme
MRIRKATFDDADACFALCQLDNERYWGVVDFEKSASDDNVVFLVVEEGSEVVGYILGFIVPTKRTEALLHETRVRKSERGRGIGTRLVGAFCDEAFKMGSETVLAEIAPEHLRFYRDACGFQEMHSWIEVAKKKRAV